MTIGLWIRRITSWSAVPASVPNRMTPATMSRLHSSMISCWLPSVSFKYVSPYRYPRFLASASNVLSTSDHRSSSGSQTTCFLWLMMTTLMIRKARIGSGGASFGKMPSFCSISPIQRRIFCRVCSFTPGLLLTARETVAFDIPRYRATSAILTFNTMHLRFPCQFPHIITFNYSKV